VGLISGSRVCLNSVTPPCVPHVAKVYQVASLEAHLSSILVCMCMHDVDLWLCELWLCELSLYLFPLHHTLPVKASPGGAV
jgi:hypothetical protein